MTISLGMIIKSRAAVHLIAFRSFWIFATRRGSIAIPIVWCGFGIRWRRVAQSSISADLSWPCACISLRLCVLWAPK